jgi:Flp pilus assembly protein TadD
MILTSRAALTGCGFHVEFARRILREKSRRSSGGDGFHMATPDEMYDEAVALKDQGNLEGAIARFNEILAIDDKHVLAHSALAVSLQKVGRAEEAIRHATRVTEIEPDDPFSFTQLSVILQRCGKIPEAETALYRAREMSGHQHRH